MQVIGASLQVSRWKRNILIAISILPRFQDLSVYIQQLYW